MALVSKKLQNGSFAEFEFSEDNKNVLILKIDGIMHSAVNIADPSVIAFDYIKEVHKQIDTVFYPGQGISCLFLGGGAYSLARAIELERTSSLQKVVEISQEIIDFVDNTIPLTKGSRIDVVRGDAKTEIFKEDIGGPYNFIFIDVFSGSDCPEWLLEEDYMRRVYGLLSPGGLLALNITDNFSMKNTLAQINNAISVSGQRLVIAAFPPSTKSGYRNVILSYRKKY